MVLKFCGCKFIKKNNKIFKKFNKNGYYIK